MPKLVQINSTANWGSTGRIAEQIGLAAMGADWESYIAYGRYANPSESRLIKIGSKIDVLWHWLMTRLFDCHGLASRIATRRLVRQLKRIKPDVVHLHNIHGYYLNYKILFDYLNSTNIPVVWTLHDCWAFTGHCAHFVELGCEKWRDGCRKCKGLSLYPASLRWDSSARNHKLKTALFAANSNLHIVAVSEWLQTFVKGSKLSSADSRVIRNGIDLSNFKPMAGGADAPKLRIIGVASAWTKSKGLLDFYALRERLDKTKYAIVLVGLSKEQKRDLPQGIIGIERTNSVAQLAELYSQALVFLNLTYADTFPTTNLEAMACGTPVVTYQTGGSAESVTPQTGYVVAQGDVDGVCRAIEEIAQKGKTAYVEACRRRAEECFDKAKSSDQYLDLYNELLNKNNIRYVNI